MKPVTRRFVLLLNYLIKSMPLVYPYLTSYYRIAINFVIAVRKLTNAQGGCPDFFNVSIAVFVVRDKKILGVKNFCLKN